MIDLKKLRAYRLRTYRIEPAHRVKTLKQAESFINERGCAFFWPISGMEFPSLWKATVGDRDVPNDHDDPGHITWNWKDTSLDKRIWYYAKILRRKATFISLKTLPYFYALSENYGSPEEDYLLAYESGRLTQAAKQIYEVVLEEGAMDTVSLRKAARLLNAKDSLFNRALEDLQCGLKILPVGVAAAGAWRYAFRYELTVRHFPELQEQARMISEGDARQELIRCYFASMGSGPISDLVKLFGWSQEIARRAVKRLVDSGELIGGESHPTIRGEWYSLPGLVMK